MDFTVILDDKLTPDEQKAWDIICKKQSMTTDIEIQAHRMLRMDFSKKEIAMYLVENRYLEENK